VATRPKAIADGLVNILVPHFPEEIRADGLVRRAQLFAKVTTGERETAVRFRRECDPRGGQPILAFFSVRPHIGRVGIFENSSAWLWRISRVSCGRVRPCSPVSLVLQIFVETDKVRPAEARANGNAVPAVA